MDMDLYRRYRRERNEHPVYDAKTAGLIARSALRRAHDWYDGNAGNETHSYLGSMPTLRHTIFERDGYRVVARIVYDEDYSPIGDDDAYGRFTSRQEDGAVKNRNAGWHEYEWYVPSWSREDRIKQMRTMGYTDAQARAYADESLHQEIEFLAGRLGGYYGVCVSIYALDDEQYRNELGNNELWGIGVYDDDDSYFDEIADDCAFEAISQADKDAQRTLDLMVAAISGV